MLSYRYCFLFISDSLNVNIVPRQLSTWKGKTERIIQRIIGIFQHQIDILPRVRHSYSLKAKTCENVGIFVLALKRKKVGFFAWFACMQKTPKQQKK
jgi:hypothetical protein